jgi:hypothetical protein
MRDFLRIQLFVFCCLLGGWAGSFLSLATMGKWSLEQYRAAHPGEYVCGLFALPYMALGFVPGAVVGALVAWRIQRWFAGPRP